MKRMARRAVGARWKLWLAVLVLTPLALIAFAPSANAFPAYRTEAIVLLRLEPDKPDGTRVVGCTLCHVSAEGGPAWNPFGQLVQSKLSGDIRQAIYAALEAYRDSDGDGFEDVFEVFARTMPGDPNSKPSESREALRARFEAAGGLAQYRP